MPSGGGQHCSAQGDKESVLLKLMCHVEDAHLNGWLVRNDGSEMVIPE